MTLVDKQNILTKIKDINDLVLELGCGPRKQFSHAIGIDMLDYECVDIVGDIFEVLEKIPDNSVTAIYSSHFFEHIADLNLLMSSIERILKIEGVLHIVVPHFSNPYFYSDYTHKSFFGLYTFCYLASHSLFQRKVTYYQREIRCELVSVDLIFKSSRPFYFRYIIKKTIEKFVNLSNYTKEFYEENLCYLFPCHEIVYRLKKIK